MRHTIALGVEEEDRKRTWLDDAESCLTRGSVEAARAIYAHSLAAYVVGPAPCALRSRPLCCLQSIYIYIIRYILYNIYMIYII